MVENVPASRCDATDIYEIAIEAAKECRDEEIITRLLRVVNADLI